jgi:two-component system, NtrC family, response regulator AtoC
MLPPACSRPGLSAQDEAASGSLSESGVVCAVLVCDAGLVRYEAINNAVSNCGARPLWLKDHASVEKAECSSNCSVALIAAEDGPYPEEPVLGLVRRLKQKGFTVICYREQAGALPLGRRCSVLLAGALALLDSAGPEFESELTHMLASCLSAEAGRLFEEEGLKRAMRGLGIVGESPAMLSIFRRVLRVSALSDLPVLITGETGTGKDLLVQAISQLDRKRCQGPLVALNCSSVSPGLAESELFGHRRGAFTGAERERKGLFRAAEGGILFLDEVGELDQALQAKLLRVLQAGRVLGVGEDQEVQVSVRVVAATNRNLEALVEAGKFRSDLFHRLNILSVHIPPLRQRPADLRPLVEHFVKKHSSLCVIRNVCVGAEFVEALAQLEFPGNVRQLENLVRRALVFKNDDGPLSLSDLPAEVWQELSDQANAADSQQPSSPAGPPGIDSYLLSLFSQKGWNLSDSIEHCEKLMLESALRHTRGNQTQTAKLLGITPRSVYNKLRKHQLH